MIWIEREKGVVVTATEKESVTEGIVDVVDQEVDPENGVVIVEGIDQDHEIGIGLRSLIKDQDRRKEDGDPDLILKREGKMLNILIFIISQFLGSD